MRLKNFLIVVKDIERSKRFYHDLFGLEMILDNDGNMILTDGLVLQEEKYWKEFLGKEIITENNSCELYFEETDIEGFIKKLESYYPRVKYVNRLMTHSWGQKVIRFYDPSYGVRHFNHSIIYYRGKIVGGIYDDRFLVKKTKSAIALMPDAEKELPYEGAKEMLLVDDVENRDFLNELMKAMYPELPAPKKKKK
jgi:catechol 2,3-dioxygenase-like lactoylglutathione lyase family enzyme